MRATTKNCFVWKCRFFGRLLSVATLLHFRKLICMKCVLVEEKKVFTNINYYLNYFGRNLMESAKLTPSPTLPLPIYAYECSLPDFVSTSILIGKTIRFRWEFINYVWKRAKYLFDQRNLAIRSCSISWAAKSICIYFVYRLCRFVNGIHVLRFKCYRKGVTNNVNRWCSWAWPNHTKQNISKR